MLRRLCALVVTRLSVVVQGRSSVGVRLGVGLRLIWEAQMGRFLMVHASVVRARMGCGYELQRLA